jgi:hypothetical protein
MSSCPVLFVSLRNSCLFYFCPSTCLSVPLFLFLFLFLFLPAFLPSFLVSQPNSFLLSPLPHFLHLSSTLYYLLVISIFRRASFQFTLYRKILFLLGVIFFFRVTINFFSLSPPLFERFLYTSRQASRCPFIASFDKVNHWSLSKARLLSTNTELTRLLFQLLDRPTDGRFSAQNL